MNFRVRGGTVTVHPPDGVLIPVESHITDWCHGIAFKSTRDRESGITPTALKERVKTVYGRIPQYRLSKKDIDDQKRNREEQKKETKS